MAASAPSRPGLSWALVLAAAVTAAAHPGANGRIAFTRTEPGGTPKVFALHPQGGSMGERFAGLKPPGSEGAWSPDGARFAMTLATGEHTTERFVLTKGKAGLKLLTTANDQHPAASASQADWYPDGTRIAFTRIAPGQISRSVWIMDADGNHPFQVTSGRANDDQPEWSPDGTRLVFVSDRDGPGTTLYTRKPIADGPQAEERPLTAAGPYLRGASLAHPRWEALPGPPPLPPRPHGPARASGVVAPPGGVQVPHDASAPAGGVSSHPPGGLVPEQS
jgi:Tol biopolymer transport system component